MPRRRLPRFQVVLQTSSRHEPVVLRSAADSDQATIAFDEELQRLTTQGLRGELTLLNHNKGGGPILRYPLGPLEQARAIPSHMRRPDPRNAGEDCEAKVPLALGERR